jgi:hypothetical protein
VSGGSFLFQENIGTHEVCIIGTCVANEGDVIESRVGDYTIHKNSQLFRTRVEQIQGNGARHTVCQLMGVIDSQLLLIIRITDGSARVQNLI